MWNKAHKPADEFCDQLSSANNFAGAVIGDNWVAAFMVHLDLLGPVYTMKWHKQSINVPKGVSPSLNDVKGALASCWQSFGNGVKVEYSKFFLCVPGWFCRSVNSTCEVQISNRWGSRRPGIPRVEQRHVRLLEKTITSANLPPDSVVVDFVPRSFILDDGQRMVDPVGAATKKLGLDAHLIVADGFWVSEVLGSLGKMGVRVDAVMSSFGATADLLTDDEKLNDTIVIDVGARNTYVGFYNDGRLSATKTVRGGGDNVIDRVARDLQLPVADVTSSIAQFKLLLYGGENEVGGECPLFFWRTKLPVVRDLDNAAVPFADSLLNSIWHEVELLQEERGLNVRNAIILGDNPLVVRSLLTAVKEKTALRCRRGVPDNVHKNADSDSPGYAQMVSMVRQLGAGVEPREDILATALGRYGDSVANTILQDVGSVISSYFAKLRSRETGSRLRLGGHSAMQGSRELLQTFRESRYLSST